MSEEAVEIARRFEESWNEAEDGAELLPLLDPVFEWVNPSYALEPGVQRGHDGWLAACANLDAGFSEYDHELHELEDLGDRVLARTTFRARTRDGGVRFEKDEWHLFTIRGGRIARLQWFHGRDEALRAAGLDG